MHKDGHEHNLRRFWCFLQCTVQSDGGTVCPLSKHIAILKILGLSLMNIIGE